LKGFENMTQHHSQSQNDDLLVALGRTLQTLREEENADVLIETTLDYLTREFDYRLIWIAFYDRLEHRLFGKGGITPSGDISFLKQWFNLHPGDLLEQVVIQQRPVGVPDLRQEIRAGEWRRAAQDFNIQGTLLFPLRYKDRCYGVALLGSPLWGVSPRPPEKAQLSLLFGELASALYQIEVDWQRTSVKRPDRALFQVLDEIMQVPTSAQRLEAVVKMTQQFVTPTRTNLYWYSPERRYFWHRVGNREPIPRMGSMRTNAPGITVAEVNDFYMALAAGQLVSIGSGRSLLKSESTQRLLGRLRARSLLAAPIQVQGKLLGFLSVEDSDARIWEEAELKYVRACAQLVAMVMGTEELETTLQETQKNAQFAAEIARVIAGNHDINATIKDCAKLLSTRLEADRFFVLQEEDNSQFTLVFGTQSVTRRPLHSPLPPVSSNTRQWLFNSTEALMIEDLELDWRLIQWREAFQVAGVRSVLLVPLGHSLLMGQTFKPNNSEQLEPSKRCLLLMVAHGKPRTWTPTERELASIVAQQINLLFLLNGYTESAKQSFLAQQTLQTGLSTLFQAPLDPVQLERLWLTYLANLLECPFAALIDWTPESETATIAATVVADPTFALAPDLTIPIANDALIQKILATRTFVCCSVADLSASTRHWLNSPGIGQVLAIALYTDAIPTTGIVLLADREERRWPQHLLPVVETLTQQFTWLRHYQYCLTQYAQGVEDLQTLNWYKHRCLDILHHSVRESASALLELETKLLPASSMGGVEDSDPKDGGENRDRPDPGGGQSLRHMYRQQLLHQLEQTLAVLTPVLQEEQWQLSVKPRSISLANLLKRTLHRVEPLYQQSHLGLQVYNSANKNIYGDRLKLECILFEVLVTFCFHAQPRSRINIWCSPFNPEAATISPASSRPLQELLIAESGVLDECLQAVTFSPPLPPLNLNLEICQQVLRSWGGDLLFYQLVSGASVTEPRYSSRLLIPLAN
jgi:GAF domain-containing protein